MNPPNDIATEIGTGEREVEDLEELERALEDDVNCRME